MESEKVEMIIGYYGQLYAYKFDNILNRHIFWIAQFSKSDTQKEKKFV